MRVGRLARPLAVLECPPKINNRRDDKSSSESNQVKSATLLLIAKHGHTTLTYSE
jgi:hypothetical protein